MNDRRIVASSLVAIIIDLVDILLRNGGASLTFVTSR